MDAINLNKEKQNVWLEELPNKPVPLAVVACYNGEYLEFYLAKFCIEKKVWREFNSQIPIFRVTHYFIIQDIPRL